MVQAPRTWLSAQRQGCSSWSVDYYAIHSPQKPILQSDCYFNYYPHLLTS
jgi:hypothetical protein